jgi:hypothetical protein
VSSVAIFIGRRGLGKWQSRELEVYLLRSTSSVIPINVIPVLLPFVDNIPDKLLFLRTYRQVKFERSTDEKDALEGLLWGITGSKPSGKFEN